MTSGTFAAHTQLTVNRNSGKPIRKNGSKQLMHRIATYVSFFYLLFFIVIVKRVANLRLSAQSLMPVADFFCWQNFNFSTVTATKFDLPRNEQKIYTKRDTFLNACRRNTVYVCH